MVAHVAAGAGLSVRMGAPRIGILETGSLEPELTARHGTMADWFTRYLGAGVQTAEFAAYECFDGTMPATPDECDAWLITGSALSVYDDDPWIAELIAFTRRAADARPVIGICFGHQVVAEAFGGRVEKSARGWGIGVHEYDIAERRPWMTSAAASLALLASHQDQVVEAPPGAEILATSPFCPIAMMQIGNTVMSIQTHPEMTQAFAGERYRSRRETIGGETVDRALASLERPTDEAVFRDWLFAFIESATRHLSK